MKNLLWYVAAAGARVATGLSIVGVFGIIALLVGRDAALLPLVAGLLAVVVTGAYSNLWLAGAFRRPRRVRALGVTVTVISAIMLWVVGGIALPPLAEVLALGVFGFYALMSLLSIVVPEQPRLSDGRLEYTGPKRL